MIFPIHSAHHVSYIPTIQGVTLYRLCNWILFIGLLVWTGCKDQAEVQKEDLYGKWEIRRAVRNQQVTPYLRGGYFLFEPDGMLTVNITGQDEKAPFSLKDQVLHHKSGKDFIIQSITGDSMSILYNLNEETTFVIYLNKLKNEAH